MKNKDKKTKNTMKKFLFFTKTLKAYKEKDGTRYIIGIASSTSIDRDNDRMSEAALHTMKSTAEANLTLFTNHEYRVPDDLFGSCVEAIVSANKDEEPIVLKAEEDGEEVSIATFYPQDFEIKIKVVSDEVNPRAGQLYKAVEEGVSLGFSIGGAVKKLKTVKDVVTNTVHTLIDAIDLYEISIVGIPSNVDAMNLAIAKSIKGVDAPEITTDEVEKIIEKSEKAEDKEHSLKDASKRIVQELKKCYDEYCYSEPTAAEKAEQERADQNWARAQAENVLMSAGEKVKVLDEDDDVIHISSHTWDMEWKMSELKDTDLQAEHLKKHLKKLEKTMKEDSDA